MQRKLAAAAALALGLASATAALAHHSFNMFALDKVTTIDATVKSVSWKMPHVWIYVVIPGSSPGGLEEWGMEGHSPNLIARKGWKSSTLEPGDKVQIAMHPMKDGSHAGSLIYAVVGGQKLWNADSLNNP